MNQKALAILVSFVLTLLALSMRVSKVFLSPPSQTVQIGSLVDLTIEGEFDPRNELNQPISGSKAKNELEALFVNGLYSLFMDAKLPMVAELMSSLTRLAAKTAAAFTRGVIFYCQTACDVIALSLRRNSHYWILQGTVAFQVCLLLLTFLACCKLLPSSPKINLPIRC